LQVESQLKEEVDEHFVALEKAIAERKATLTKQISEFVKSTGIASQRFDALSSSILMNLQRPTWRL